MYRSQVQCEACSNNTVLIKKSLISDEDKRLSQQKVNLELQKGQQFIMEGTPVSGLFFIQKERPRF